MRRIARLVFRGLQLVVSGLISYATPRVLIALGVPLNDLITRATIWTLGLVPPWLTLNVVYWCLWIVLTLALYFALGRAAMKLGWLAGNNRGIKITAQGPSPNTAWALRERLEIYEIACLMAGKTPRLPVKDKPENDFLRLLKDHISAGNLAATMKSATPDVWSTIKREDLRSFLRLNRIRELEAFLQTWDRRNLPGATAQIGRDTWVMEALQYIALRKWERAEFGTGKAINDQLKPFVSFGKKRAPVFCPSGGTRIFQVLSIRSPKTIGNTTP